MNLNSTIIGALIGLGGVIVGALITGFRDWCMTCAERRRLALAFAAEIETIYLLLEESRLLEVLQENYHFFGGMREPFQEVTAPPFKCRLPIPEGSFAVYQSNVAKIGLLPRPIPGQLVRVHIRLAALKQDMEFISNFSQQWTVDHAYSLCENLICNFGDVLDTTEFLIVQLYKLAHQKPPTHLEKKIKKLTEQFKKLARK